MNQKDRGKIISRLMESVRNNKLQWEYYYNSFDEERYTCLYLITKNKNVRIELTQKKLSGNYGYNYYVYIFIDKERSSTPIIKMYYNDYPDIFKLFIFVKYRYHLDSLGRENFIEKLKKETLSSRIKWIKNQYYYVGIIIKEDKPDDVFQICVYKNIIYLSISPKTNLSTHFVVNHFETDLYEFLEKNIESKDVE